MLAIIAAAGRGTRMKSQLPKPLTRLKNGKTFLDSLVEKVDGTVDEIVIVINDELLSHPLFVKNSRCVYKIQSEPTGMGDAIFCAREEILEHENIIVAWSDQVGLTKNTLEETSRLQKSLNLENHITIPVLPKTNGYIHIEHEDNKIIGIYQSREKDVVPSPSLSDVGLFGLSGGLDLISKWENGGRDFAFGRETHEYNFLPFLHYLSTQSWSVEFIAATLSDGYGVNTKGELIEVQKGEWL